MGTHPIFESDFDCLTDEKSMPVYMSIEQLGRSSNLTCFELILQLVSFLAFSILLVLRHDFNFDLECWDVYLPLLLGDFFHIYHSFNRYFRYILQPNLNQLTCADVVQHRDRFRRGVTFTILASISKYFFYLALADDLNYAEKDPEQKVWRTVGMGCLSL